MAVARGSRAGLKLGLHSPAERAGWQWEAHTHFPFRLQPRSLRTCAAVTDPVSTSKTCVPVHVPASGDPTRVLGKVRRSLVSPLFSPVTLEFQREKAKELTKFFKQQSANALINDSTCAPKGSQTTELTFHTRTHACPPPRRSVFGWTKSNEINNGRWVMFGLLVGLMTELATGVVCSASLLRPLALTSL